MCVFLPLGQNHSFLKPPVGLGLWYSLLRHTRGHQGRGSSLLLLMSHGLWQVPSEVEIYHLVLSYPSTLTTKNNYKSGSPATNNHIRSMEDNCEWKEGLMPTNQEFQVAWLRQERGWCVDNHALGGQKDKFITEDNSRDGSSELEAQPLSRSISLLQGSLRTVKFRGVINLPSFIPSAAWFMLSWLWSNGDWSAVWISWMHLHLLFSTLGKTPLG